MFPLRGKLLTALLKPSARINLTAFAILLDWNRLYNSAVLGELALFPYTISMHHGYDPGEPFPFAGEQPQCSHRCGAPIPRGFSSPSLPLSPLEQSPNFYGSAFSGLAGSHAARKISTIHIHGPPHISSDLALLGFWCALDACKIKISKYRFFAKSGIRATAEFDIVVFRPIFPFTFATLLSR